MTGVPAESFERAARLVDHYSQYIGRVAPGAYADLIADLNEHFLAVDALARQGLVDRGKCESPECGRLRAERAASFSQDAADDSCGR